MKTYHGKPCKHCNSTERYKSSYGCVTCTKSKSHNNEYLRAYAKRPKAVARRRNYMSKYPKKKEVQQKYYNKLETKQKLAEYYKNNKDIWKQAQLKKYNLSVDEYNILYEQQGGKCAICEIPAADLNKSLHVDHDHKTHVVRGLLCHHCNTGLGLFKDDLKLFEKAMQYLKRGL